MQQAKVSVWKYLESYQEKYLAELFFTSHEREQSCRILILKTIKSQKKLFCTLFNIQMTIMKL